jgi:ABC-type lipoprotein export system ATPase subunit
MDISFDGQARRNAGASWVNRAVASPRSAAAILQLLSPDQAARHVVGPGYRGKLPAEEMRKRRKDLQIIFQDPLASLNPRMTVGEIIADPLRSLMPELNAKGAARPRHRTMEAVGLLPEMINRYPHEFSGGQAQRIGIARALITEPKLIVCDEPVSALDVSIQAQILNLLSRSASDDLRASTLIFISHNLSRCPPRLATGSWCSISAGRWKWPNASRSTAAAASLYAGAQFRRAGAGPRYRAEQGTHRAEGRPALAAQPALRLSVL